MLSMLPFRHAFLSFRPLTLLLIWPLFFSGGCATPRPATPRERAANDLRALTQALTRYHHETGHWPSNGEGLSALVNATGAPTAARFSTGQPLDPWGNRYQYRFNPAQGHVTLWSFGEDVVNSDDDVRSEVRIKK